MSTVNKKTLVIQLLLWILLSLIFTSAFSVLLFRRLPITGTVDMQVHDTMFVINGWLTLLPLFLLVAFLLAFVFGIRNSVGSRRHNPTTISTGICFIIVTGALSGRFLSKNVDSQAGRVVFFVLLAIQVIVAILSLMVFFRWRKFSRNGASNQKLFHK